MTTSGKVELSVRRGVIIKRRRVQVHVLLSQGFKARTDATVDPHEKRLQLSHFGNELEKGPTANPGEGLLKTNFFFFFLFLFLFSETWDKL